VQSRNHPGGYRTGGKECQQNESAQQGIARFYSAKIGCRSLCSTQGCPALGSGPIDRVAATGTTCGPAGGLAGDGHAVEVASGLGHGGARAPGQHSMLASGAPRARVRRSSARRCEGGELT
jgi:hypothetical protein